MVRPQPQAEPEVPGGGRGGAAHSGVEPRSETTRRSPSHLHCNLRPSESPGSRFAPISSCPELTCF